MTPLVAQGQQQKGCLYTMITVSFLDRIQGQKQAHTSEKVI